LSVMTLPPSLRITVIPLRSIPCRLLVVRKALRAFRHLGRPAVFR
jgi:hypothetical protein